MADWLALLLKIGGFGAVLFLALFVMGRWLLKRITAALDSYTTAYAQQTASIDARIANLEKLAEEQARLTRTVESIKDEIASEAKSRDNRWAFRKEVYVNLIAATNDLIRAEVALRVCSRRLPQAPAATSDPNEESQSSILNIAKLAVEQQTAAAREFVRSASLAPLAMAGSIVDSIATIRPNITVVSIDDPNSHRLHGEAIDVLSRFLQELQAAGHRDLWGTPESEAKAGAAISGI